ncbi:hypothetical protein K1719_042293 [Acacia pycnantha]|nr:hypothetical protein K1719_042293 [Acacia pycnantha]
MYHTSWHYQKRYLDEKHDQTLGMHSFEKFKARLSLRTIAYHKEHCIDAFPSLGKPTTPLHPLVTHDSESIPSNLVQDLLAEVEKDRLERTDRERIRVGLDTKDIDAETRQDYMGVRPILRKLRRQKIKDSKELDEYEEPTDSDSDDEDERFSPEAIQQRFEDFERKFKKHEELLKNFTDAGISPVDLFDLFIIY